MIQERIDEIKEEIEDKNEELKRLEQEIIDMTKTQDKMKTQIKEKSKEGAKAINNKVTGDLETKKDIYKEKIKKLQEEIEEKEMETDLILMACLKRGVFMCTSDPQFLTRQFGNPDLNEAYGNYLGFFGEKMRELEEKWQNKVVKEAGFFRKELKGIKGKMTNDKYKEIRKQFNNKAENKEEAKNNFNKEAIETIRDAYEDELPVDWAR